MQCFVDCVDLCCVVCIVYVLCGASFSVLLYHFGVFFDDLCLIFVGWRDLCCFGIRVSMKITDRIAGDLWILVTTILDQYFVLIRKRVHTKRVWVHRHEREDTEQSEALEFGLFA